MKAYIHTLFKSCLLKAAPVARQNTNRIPLKSQFYAISGTFTPEVAFCVCIIAGVYIDEGISGTQATKRLRFMQMIRQCQRGNIDMIITKSVSRFARKVMTTTSSGGLNMPL